MFINDFKLCLKTEHDLVQTVRIFSRGTEMDFCLDKCKLLIMKSKLKKWNKIAWFKTNQKLEEQRELQIMQRAWSR